MCGNGGRFLGPVAVAKLPQVFGDHIDSDPDSAFRTHSGDCIVYVCCVCVCGVCVRACVLCTMLRELKEGKHV